MKKLYPWLIAILLIYILGNGPLIYAFHYFEFSNNPYCYKIYAAALYPHLIIAAYSEAYYNYLQWWIKHAKPTKPIPHKQFKQIILEHL